MVAKAPAVELKGEMGWLDARASSEIDEVYAVAGYKGQPAAVSKRGGLGRETIPADRVKTPYRNGNKHLSNSLASHYDMDLRADSHHGSYLARRRRAFEFSHGLPGFRMLMQENRDRSVFAGMGG